MQWRTCYVLVARYVGLEIRKVVKEVDRHCPAVNVVEAALKRRGETILSCQAVLLITVSKLERPGDPERFRKHFPEVI